MNLKQPCKCAQYHLQPIHLCVSSLFVLMTNRTHTKKQILNLAL